MSKPIDRDLAERVAKAAGISLSAARHRIRNWHPLRWQEPPQANASGVNHQRPAPKAHPWSSQSYRLKQAERAARNRT